jgi:hypothetical protein
MIFRKCQISSALLAAWMLTAFAVAQTPMGTAFTYQGSLQSPPGNPVTDTCNFRFGLWNAASGGSQRGTSPQSVTGVSVEDGLFTAEIDFGTSAFDGDARWLQIEVACPAGAAFTLLAPRVELTPAPYALRALNGVGPPNALNVTAIGDVGIATANPQQELQVGQTSGNVAVRLGTFGAGDWDLVRSVGSGFASGSFGIQRVGAASPSFVMDASGRIGVGTISPAAKLHLAGTPGTDGIMFPDGTVQTTAASASAAGECCSDLSARYEHAFLLTSNSVSGGNGVQLAPAPPAGTVRYVTGIVVRNRSSATPTGAVLLYVRDPILGPPVVGTTETLRISDGESFSSGGGAPILFLSAPNALYARYEGTAPSAHVTVTGYEYP